MNRVFQMLAISIVFSGCASVSEPSLTSTAPHSVVVDYGRTIEDLLQAGQFGWVNSEMTSRHFPSTGSGKRQVMVVLTELPRYVTIDRIIQTQRQRQLRPATIRELLAFAQDYPDAQLDYPIVCLGSHCMLYAKGRSAAADTPYRMQMNTELPRSDQWSLKQFWPYLDSQGSRRTVNLGQMSVMRQDPLQTIWGCFVKVD
jgi:hypothetical protein